MEHSLNTKVTESAAQFCEDVATWLKTNHMEITNQEGKNGYEEFMSYIHSYEKLQFTKEDLKKRSRTKTLIATFERCCALRSNHEQCTRKSKKGEVYCGTHIKGRPYGVLEAEPKSADTKLEVWLEDINGVHQYTDKEGNIYSSEDILQKVTFPRIIAKKKVPIAITEPKP